MKIISFQCKTAKNQFYLLMMLIVNKTLLNLRSQNRTLISNKISFTRISEKDWERNMDRQ